MMERYCLMGDFAHFGLKKEWCWMLREYFSLREFRDIWRQINYAPNGAGGAYCKSGQKKRRKNRRRNGKWRRQR